MPWRVLSNINIIRRRYRRRAKRVPHATREAMREMGSFLKQRAINASSYKAYRTGRWVKMVIEEDGEKKTVSRRYPYARRYSPDGPPLGYDALINVDSGAVQRGWGVLRRPTSHGMAIAIFNAAPHAKYLFSRKGTHIGSGGMRPRPMWELLFKVARSHMYQTRDILFARLLYDADVTPVGG